MQTVWLGFAVVEAPIWLRFMLKVVGANPEDAFARDLYNTTALFVNPFLDLVPPPVKGNMVLELPTPIAPAVYAMGTWVAVRLVWLIFAEPAARSVVSYEDESS